jgi:methylthioribose-1-phosphate isomerase
VERIRQAVTPLPEPERAGAAWALAGRMAEEDVAACEAIGRHGAELLRGRFPDQGARPLQVLTHCNAGWLATVDWGTALAPVYRLHDDGVPVHVWVSETRPRNQGLLTAWELGRHGVRFMLVVDNSAAHLLDTGRVDCCLVGADRITAAGDVCNKVGTALKARAADAAGVPFYVAAPGSTIDWTMTDARAIPIEERTAAEVTPDPGLPVFNPGFDITPARLVDRLITERGVVAATSTGLAGIREVRS